jgi:hypothetical protein
LLASTFITVLLDGPVDLIGDIVANRAAIEQAKAS